MDALASRDSQPCDSLDGGLARCSGFEVSACGAAVPASAAVVEVLDEIAAPFDLLLDACRITQDLVSKPMCTTCLQSQHMLAESATGSQRQTHDTSCLDSSSSSIGQFACTLPAGLLALPVQTLLPEAQIGYHPDVLQVRLPSPPL